jgi:hypothetical protein
MAKSEPNAPVPDKPTPAYLAYCETIKGYCPAPMPFDSWWKFSDRNTQVLNRETGERILLQD